VRRTCYKQASKAASWRVLFKCRDCARGYSIRTRRSTQSWITAEFQKVDAIGEPSEADRGVRLALRSAATGEDGMMPMFGASARSGCV
jgi:hypothetical protein